jgi:hypothetical protein
MNPETTAPAPEVTVGLPSGLDPQKVLERKKALLSAGMDPVYAEKFAVDAELEQARRDARHAALIASETAQEKAPKKGGKKKAEDSDEGGDQ